MTCGLSRIAYNAAGTVLTDGFLKSTSCLPVAIAPLPTTTTLPVGSSLTETGPREKHRCALTRKSA